MTSESDGSNSEPECVVLVVDQRKSTVLVRTLDDTFWFPRFQISESCIYEPAVMTEHVSSCLKLVMGTLFDLQFLFHTRWPVSIMTLCMPPEPQVFAFECRAVKKTEFNKYAWINVQNYNSSPFPDDGDRRALPSLLKCLGSDEIGKGLRLCERPGWFDETSAAMLESLTELGYVVSGTVEYWRYLERSALLQAYTDKGTVYLKFCDNPKECSITECVGTLFPRFARKPLCVNRNKQWILMEDYGTPISLMSSEEYDMAQVLLAQLQLESMKHIPKLVSAGAPRTDPAWIVDKFKELLHDENILKLFSPQVDDVPLYTGKEEPDIEFYCDLMESFMRLLYETSNLPLTLVHGDMHSSNIIMNESMKADQVVFFDWDTARIDLPFTDISVMRDWFYKWKEGPSISYLEMWKEYGSAEDLEQMIPLCRQKDAILSLLHDYEKLQRDYDVNVEEDIIRELRLQCGILQCQQEMLNVEPDEEYIDIDEVGVSDK